MMLNSESGSRRNSQLWLGVLLFVLNVTFLAPASHANSSCPDSLRGSERVSDPFASEAALLDVQPLSWDEKIDLLSRLGTAKTAITVKFKEEVRMPPHLGGHQVKIALRSGTIQGLQTPITVTLQIQDSTQYTHSIPLHQVMSVSVPPSSLDTIPAYLVRRVSDITQYDLGDRIPAPQLKPIRLDHEISLSGVVGDHIRAHAKGVMTVYEFIDGIKKSPPDGFVLGPSLDFLDQAIARGARLTDWRSYSSSSGFTYRSPDQAPQFMQLLVNTGKPIYFFVSRDSWNPASQFTAAELRWLLSEPSRMHNVFFVFGAFEAIPLNVREQIKTDNPNPTVRMDAMWNLLLNYRRFLPRQTPERFEPPQIPVRLVKIVIENVDLKPDESAYLVGSDPLLGGWDVAQAIGPVRKGSNGSIDITAPLPLHTPLPYKIVIVDGSGNTRWQEGNNRLLRLQSKDNEVRVRWD